MTVNGATPAGWAGLKLGELFVSEQRGIEPARFPDQAFELWSVPAFPTGAPEVVRGRDIGSNKQRVSPGDVLLCKINPRINRVWVVGEAGELPQIASTEWIVLRGAGVDPDYLAYQLRESGFRARLCAEVSGVGGSLTRARPQAVAELEVVVAPATEQRRIVEKLDELMASSRAARAALDAVPALLEQYRQSVLAAAFRGELTDEWRSEHPHVHSGDALLASLDEDLTDVSRGRRAREKTGVEPAELPPLPESWRWGDADRCTRRLTVGHVGPMQTRYTPDGVPFLRSQNVRENRIDPAGLQFIPQDFHRELAKSALSPGDVVIVRSGAPGVAAVVPPDLLDANCADLVIARFSDLINPELIVRFINSQQCRQRIFDRQVGVAQQHFNVGAMRTLPIPVMPLEEQEELLRILREHEETITRVRERVQSAHQRLAELDAAALAKAFRGELVPQNPTDGPAEAILARLRAERSANPTGRQRRRTGAPV